MDDAAPTRAISLTAQTVGFIDDPYPAEAALRRASPLHVLGPGSRLFKCHADLLAACRGPLVSSDNVARLEARIGIGALLARYPRIQAAGAAGRDRRARFRGLGQLPVTPG